MADVIKRTATIPQNDTTSSAIDIRTSTPDAKFVLFGKFRTAGNVTVTGSTNGTDYYPFVDQTNNYSDNPTVIATGVATAGRLVDITALIGAFRGYLKIVSTGTQADATSVITLFVRE